MARIDEALRLAERGFYLFPVVANGKVPAISDWQEHATRDADTLTEWFAQDYNIGISTSRYGESQALVVVDVDTKNGKDGNAELFNLDMQGYELPVTFEQSTPSGGRHLIYVADKPCRQGTDVLGRGLDIRSQGGLIVGPGSAIDGKAYRQINGHGTVAPAPQWLVDRLGQARTVAPAAHIQLPGVDVDRANGRAIAWLKDAPVSVEGEGGDITAFKVAAKLKDFGCTEEQALGLLVSHWNERCEPQWSLDELTAKVAHAYRYGKEPQGSAAPEAVFHSAPVPETEDEGVNPVDALNKEYAFIKAGAFVLQETTDAKGRFTTIRLSPNDMHMWFANKLHPMGDKQVPLSKVWMSRASRREYDNVVFAPQQPVSPRFYNLWRGFSVQPSVACHHAAVDMFLEHALKNMCHGDTALCHWLIGYFAHMIQRPYEKPLVALVFKGAKGTGKNALVERVGHLLGKHAMVADDERYLLGNFNSHLEANLFFVLDEASWAGDKRAEGKLKGLITGTEHVIERKGYEPYAVDNLTRVVIIGNEKWLVPASQEERRFAVFNVGDGRRQDRRFFETMRVGMENGGYAHLLRYLLDYDISAIDVNAAPNTKGLVDQKHASLEPVQEWWLDCLTADQLLGGSFDGNLPPQVPHQRLFEAFSSWAKGRNIRGRLPTGNGFIATLNAIAPSFTTHRPRNEQGSQDRVKTNPGIATLRADWDKFIGGSVDWTN